MTIARLRLGHRNLSFAIGLEPVDQDQAAAASQLEARFLREMALQEHDQRRSDWEARIFHLGHRPA